jgi:hypothetical protein
MSLFCRFFLISVLAKIMLVFDNDRFIRMTFRLLLLIWKSFFLINIVFSHKLHQIAFERTTMSEAYYEAKEVKMSLKERQTKPNKDKGLDVYNGASCNEDHFAPSLCKRLMRLVTATKEEFKEMTATIQIPPLRLDLAKDLRSDFSK